MCWSKRPEAGIRRLLAIGVGLAKIQALRAVRTPSLEQLLRQTCFACPVLQ